MIFLQGGGSLQFAMVPMNLYVPGKPVDVLHTGIVDRQSDLRAEKRDRRTGWRRRPSRRNSRACRGRDEIQLSARCFVRVHVHEQHD